MTQIKIKDIGKMDKDEREKKLKDLKIELVRSKVNASKTKNSNAGEIRKMIARILTINNLKNQKFSEAQNKSAPQSRKISKDQNKSVD